MSPASRYHSNLKVLRRRDPSIVSIFDQFSHVCIYHHNGQKWQKHGFEGSMFLYERLRFFLFLFLLSPSQLLSDSYPPYGFYILNRVGSDDYIQRLYPEDDITTHGGYLMLRSYPRLSAARLRALASSDTGDQPKFSELYAYVGDAATVASKNQEASQTIGLWTFTTDGREPLMDVMLRYALNFLACNRSLLDNLDSIHISRKICLIPSSTAMAQIGLHPQIHIFVLPLLPPISI